jgi:hypothetical protein
MRFGSFRQVKNPGDSPDPNSKDPAPDCQSKQSGTVPEKKILPWTNQVLSDIHVPYLARQTT